MVLRVLAWKRRAVCHVHTSKAFDWTPVGLTLIGDSCVPIFSQAPLKNKRVGNAPIDHGLAGFNVDGRINREVLVYSRYPPFSRAIVWRSNGCDCELPYPGPRGDVYCVSSVRIRRAPMHGRV